MFVLNNCMHVQNVSNSPALRHLFCRLVLAAFGYVVITVGRAVWHAGALCAHRISAALKGRTAALARSAMPSATALGLPLGFDAGNAPRMGVRARFLGARRPPTASDGLTALFH